jgi:phospholipase C
MDLQNHTLPAVSFIKPLGPNNEHPGYADLLTGQKHVADLVNAVRQSGYWDETLIIVTYDEHGGRWDHVPPPLRNGIWGDGARVPAIVIGPFAKQGYIDSEEHDTLSIIKTIELLFDVQPLTQYDAKASSLGSSLNVPID